MRSFLRALLPKQWNKLRSMSKRQQWYELRTSMWVIPLLYVLGAVLLAFLAYMAEFGLQPGVVLGGALSTEYSLTQTTYSTMLSSTLTLNAFTFNSILVVLTSFSAQFTPYLMDEDERVRLIMKGEEFAYYVYASYAVIAMHAEEDPLLTNSLLEGLVILSKAVRRSDQPVCWDYARAIAENYRGRFPY